MRIADRLNAAQRKRFVGRAVELELFRSALMAEDAPFSVLHVYGPGGIGKTTLLQAYAQVAIECGRFVVYLDGRNVDPSPAEFVRAVHQVLGHADEESSLPLVVDGTPAWVLLLDTYEVLSSLDTWLRESFLPQLPGQSVVVIAGRNPPAPVWRTDIHWAELTRILSLRNLRPEESLSFLNAWNVPEQQRANALAWTHGHPLALALIADALRQGKRFGNTTLKDDPDIVRVLLERFLAKAPSPMHRRALEVCALAWTTSETLLTEVVGSEYGPRLFAWLRDLSFIEHGPDGLFPHELARDVFEADLRWRDPEGYRQLRQAIASVLRNRTQRASGLELLQLRQGILYVNRTVSFMESYFDWNAIGRGYVEPASTSDWRAIIALVRKYEGDASARIAAYWLRRQPSAFFVFRTPACQMVGFMAHLSVEQCSEEDCQVDPAIFAACDFMRRCGPLRTGETVLFLRFWIGSETYQNVGLTINLTATTCISAWLSSPRLAWNFISIADPEFWQPHFHGIHMRRSPEADFVVGDRCYGVFAHDWRVQSASDWQFAIAQQQPLPDKLASLRPTTSQSVLLVLSQPEFAEAVRQALRDYTRSDQLAANPLTRSRVVRSFAKDGKTTDALRALLQDALTILTVKPKERKFHNALLYTYFQPAPTQERAAELLNLPFNTYRYHLAGGIERMTAWLWQRELGDNE